MEALIFGLVIMAVSAFFNKNKKDATKRDAPVKPFSTTTSTTRESRSGQTRFKRVEDYAKELYGELQNQKTQGSDRLEEAKQKAAEVVDRTPLREARQEVERRITSSHTQSRASLSESRSIRNQPVVPKVEKASDELLPLSNEDVRRGIIMAEILMPPKSKR
ncbi:hypothetical protein GPDM_11935 [Planococcus donghaensis MPA1U2]|uniref:Uncharacterized protein n=1 Tax=Planococcus donghaensis MPA1U2 TaxID=933115 RepID=E7RIS5_9BACL|nr:hypothetical protein [Planococcus donghaensis]EGA89181.1 hypothetical protein GPDM_11935 [Planococcus donghaensis MPA1U2]